MDRKQREEKFSRYKKFAEGVALAVRKALPFWVTDLDDLKQAAYIGLIQAIERYPENRQFKSRARLRIKGEILDELNRSGIPKIRGWSESGNKIILGFPIIVSLQMIISDKFKEISLAETIAAKRTARPNDFFRANIALALLNSKQRKIVIERFAEEKPFKEIGAELGISASGAHHHFSKTINFLKLVFDAPSRKE